MSFSKETAVAAARVSAVRVRGCAPSCRRPFAARLKRSFWPRCPVGSCGNASLEESGSCSGSVKCCTSAELCASASPPVGGLAKKQPLAMASRGHCHAALEGSGSCNGSVERWACGNAALVGSGSCNGSVERWACGNDALEGSGSCSSSVERCTNAAPRRRPLAAWLKSSCWHWRPVGAVPCRSRGSGSCSGSVDRCTSAGLCASVPPPVGGLATKQL